MTETSDADRLRSAVHDAAIILSAFVGTPTAIEPDELGDFTEFDPAKRSGVLVHREEVPEILWRGAIKALDLLLISYGFSDPDAPAAESFEAEVEALLRRRST
jgi:hypothetical protein